MVPAFGGGPAGRRSAGETARPTLYGWTETFNLAVVQQHWKPPPPSPE